VADRFCGSWVNKILALATYAGQASGCCSAVPGMSCYREEGWFVTAVVASVANPGNLGGSCSVFSKICVAHKFGAVNDESPESWEAWSLEFDSSLSFSCLQLDKSTVGQLKTYRLLPVICLICTFSGSRLRLSVAFASSSSASLHDGLKIGRPRDSVTYIDACFFARFRSTFVF
jgi:hypothetical protein